MDIQIPFDGIITIMIFMIGVPAILQYMSPDIRKVILPTLIREFSFYFTFAAVIVFASVTLVIYFIPTLQMLIWSIMFILLLQTVLVMSFQILFKYSFRENIIVSLKDSVLEKKNKREILINEHKLYDLIEIGKQSKPGFDKEIVLFALKDLVYKICGNEKLNKDSLVKIIDGLVAIVINQPATDNIHSYKIAINILQTILVTTSEDKKISSYQQHAVFAVSFLGGTILKKLGQSLEVESILLEYMETLQLAVSSNEIMLTAATQALLEIGSVALEQGYYLPAIFAHEKILSNIQESPKKQKEALTDLLGLTAYFWSSGESSKEFIVKRLPRIKSCLKEPLTIALRKAQLHSQMTMRFDTADKISHMAKELKPKKTIKVKKKK